MSKIYAIRDGGPNFKALDFEIRDIRRQRPEDVPLDDLLEFGSVQNSLPFLYIYTKRDDT